jgi:hypothetical protein
MNRLSGPDGRKDKLELSDACATVTMAVLALTIENWSEKKS